MKNTEQKKNFFKFMFAFLCSFILLAVSAVSSILTFGQNSKSKDSIYSGLNLSYKSDPQEPSGNGASLSVSSDNVGAEDLSTSGVTDESVLPTASEENWQDSFAGKTREELEAFTYEQGNFYEKVGQGDGSLENPYIISTANELAFLGAVFTERGNSINDSTSMPLRDKYFKLGADIDLQGKNWTPIVNLAYSQNSVSYFDGGDFTISNVYIDDSNNTNIKSESDSFTSIFGCWPQGEIKNLKINNANIIGKYRASVVSTTGSGNYNPTTFTNITITESRVVSQRFTTSISDNATSIEDCFIDNCEIITRDSSDNDVDMKSEITRYALGIGRSNNITITNNEDLSKPAVLDSIIKMELTYSDFDSVYNTSSNVVDNKSDTIYVNGVGINKDSSSSNVFNLKVANSQIISDVTINDDDLTKDVLQNNDKYRITTTNYVAGAYQYINSSTAKVELHNIQVENSIVRSNTNFDIDNINAQNVLVTFSDNIMGVGRIYNSDISGVTHFKDLNVVNSNIESISNINAQVVPSDASDSSVYNQIYASANIYGVLYSNSSNLVSENCNVDGSEIVSNHTINTIDNSNYYQSSEVNVYGVGSGNSFMTYKGDSVTNTFFDIDNIINSGNDEDSLYHNPVYNNVYVTGIGRGTFLKNGENVTKVENVDFNINAQTNKNENDKSSLSSSSRIIGIGSGADNNSTEFDNSISKNNTFTIDNNLGTSYAFGMGANVNGSSQGFTYTDVKATDLVFNVKGYNTYVSGLSYNTNSQHGQQIISGSSSDSKIDVSNNTFNVEATNASTVAGVALNVGFSKGFTLSNITVDKVKINNKTENSTLISSGVSVNTSSLYSSTYDGQYFEHSLQDINVSNLSLIGNTTNGSVYIVGAGYSSNHYGDYYLKNVNIETSKLSGYSINSVVYVSGLAYASKSNNNHDNESDLIDSCSVRDVNIYGSGIEETNLEDLSKNDYSELKNYSRVAGLLISNSPSASNVKNSIVEDATIRAVGFQISYGGIASGMVIAFGSYKDNTNVYENNIVKNVDISSFAGVGLTNGGLSIASGMIINNDTTKVSLKNNTVENSNVNALSTTGQTYASGMLVQRNSIGGSVVDCYAINNNVTAKFLEGGNGTSTTVGAYGLAGYYVNEVSGCVVGSGEVIAHNNVGNSYASGVATTWSNSKEYSRSTYANEQPYTKIIDSYNFSNVSATTDSLNNGYASGVGHAEYIDSSSNYGTIVGNYVGGINFGYQRTYNPGDIYSIPLIIKNSVNYGDLYRAENGSTSYIGGIIGVYQMYATTYRKLVLENNVSLGGIYSKQTTNGQNSQTVSASTYLGMLYGYLNVNALPDMTQDDFDNNTQLYQDFISDFSIKNNYSLVERYGKNSGLYRDNESLKVVGYTMDSPSKNYISSPDGVFYSSFTVNGNYYELFEDLYGKITSVGEIENTNNFVDTTYSQNDFIINSSLQEIASSNGWKELRLDNNIAPQVKTNIKKQIVFFNLNGLEGSIPNVMVVDIENNQFTFTVPSANLSQTGITVGSWTLSKDNTGETITVGIEKTMEVTGYATISLYAKSDYTQYIITLSSSEGNYTLTHNGETNAEISLNNSNIELVAKFVSTEQNATGVTWQVKVKDTGDYYNLAFQTIGEENTNTINLSQYFNSEFIENYANGNNFEIRLVYSTENLYKVNISYSGVSNSNYIFSAVVDGVSLSSGDSVIQGKSIVLNTTPNSHYEFVSYTISGIEQPITQKDYTISNVTSEITITVNVKAIEYGINVQLVNKQSVSLPTDMINELIESFDSTTISIGEDLSQLTARTNYSGYRFIGWKLIGMSDSDFVPSKNGKIDANYTIPADDFDRYILNGQFNIIAVFQRQYTLNVNMVNPEGDSFASTYIVNYVDENGEEQNFTNVVEEEGEDGEINTIIQSSGSYLIDENTFVKIFVQPNKRVEVLNPVDIEFGGNTAYIYLTENKNVEFVFNVRPLDIDVDVMKVLTPDNFDGEFDLTLLSAVDYKIKQSNENILDNPGYVEIDNTLILGFDKNVLDVTKYRYIDIYLKNIKNDAYDLISEIVVDDYFFDNYVTDDGVVNIMLKVIKQYEISILGDNLVSNDNYTLGSYTVSIKDSDGMTVSSERYNVIEENKKYLIDTGLQVEITPVCETIYASFTGYTGLFEDEVPQDNDVVSANVSSDRSLALRFDKNTYNVTANINSAIGGKLNYTSSFQLGDTISLSYTPENNYQILDWKIAGKTLEEIGATLDGNTVEIVATEEFLDMFSSLISDGLILDSQLETMMSPTLFYGLIGGGVLILLLAALITFLVIRQVKLKKQKEEQERKLNDIARKFNIGSLISDLKAGKDVDFGQAKSKK